MSDNEATTDRAGTDLAVRVESLVRNADQCSYEISQIARSAKVSDHVRKRLYEISVKLHPAWVSDTERRKYGIGS